jgi:hypothetical protein
MARLLKRRQFLHVAGADQADMGLAAPTQPPARESGERRRFQHCGAALAGSIPDAIATYCLPLTSKVMPGGNDDRQVTLRARSRTLWTRG